MLILSKIKRNPGTFITMQDGTRYAFMPNEIGDHVAEVENPTHIERFLSITEGFGIYSGEVIPEGVVAEALDADDDEADDDGDDDLLDDDLSPAPDAMPLEHMTLADLQAIYERELGRKPHHRAGSEKLIEDITTHRAALQE